MGEAEAAVQVEPVRGTVHQTLPLMLVAAPQNDLPETYSLLILDAGKIVSKFLHPDGWLRPTTIQRVLSQR